MADRVDYSVSATPIELVTLAVTYTSEEQTDVLTDISDSSHAVLATEVNTSLGGSGSATVADYSATAANQGYKDKTVNYLQAPDGGGGEVAISSESTASFVFIKNTGHVFSSATVLGAVEAGRLLKVTVNSGAIIISCLDAGEAIVLKGLQATGTIDASGIKVETVNSDGSEASGGVHLSVEYLVVD